MSEQNAIVPLNTSIARPVMQGNEMIDTAWRLAQFASQSALCKSKNAYDAFFIIQYGYELGLSAMASLRTIHTINGTPACSGEAMLALIRRSKLASEITLTGDTESAKCRMSRKDTGETYEATFTFDEAKKAGLTNKDNWQKFPAKMLKWRCVSECGKFLFSDVIGGLYTIEEINPNIRITENGEIAEGELIPDEPAPVAKHVETPDTSKITQFPKTEEAASKTKFWYEDLEKLDAILAHAVAKGWIDGNTRTEREKSFASLLAGKGLSVFETGKAAIEAAEAEFNALKEKDARQHGATVGDAAESWDTLDGINAIVQWAKGKGYGDNEPALLKLLGVADWKVYADGRAACKAIEAAFNAKNPPEEGSKKDALSEIDMAAINAWAAQHFAFTPEKLVDKVDFSKFMTIKTAKSHITSKAREEHWAVMSESCTYIVNEKGTGKKFISFETLLGEMRFYPGRTEFSKLIGESYASDNGILALPANEAQEIEPILLSWKSEENYSQVYDAMPVLEPELA